MADLARKSPTSDGFRSLLVPRLVIGRLAIGDFIRPMIDMLVRLYDLP
jgi:hypothetical protein